MSTSKNSVQRTLLGKPSPASRLTGAQLRLALEEAEHLIAGRHLQAAQEVLSHLLVNDAAIPAAHHLLALIALMNQQAAPALTHAEAALTLAPKDAQLHFTHGRAHKLNNALDEAIASYRLALVLRPNFAEAHVSLGIALKSIGQLDAAIENYRAALAINPNLASAHANLGNALALQAFGDEKPGFIKKPTAEVEAAQRRALELDPDNPRLNMNLGISLMRGREYIDAAHLFNKTLSVEPAHETACINLAHCLRKLGQDQLARDAYLKWLDLNESTLALAPASQANIMRELSSVLNGMGEADDALMWGERAYALKPDGSTLQAIAGALQQGRRLEESLDYFRRALSAFAHRADSYHGYLMSLNYSEEDPDTLRREHREYGRLLLQQATALKPMTGASPADGSNDAERGLSSRLRIGYVSGDFRRHSVAFFIEPVLEHHNRARFEIFCYHNCVSEDGVTERLKRLGHHWIDCAEMSDEELFERIGTDRIDVLIDLSGHTAHSRLPLFARRPAPVQITYLGYPSITGMPAMDYRITDAVIDPESAQHDSEQSLHVAHSMFCYRPDEAPGVGEPPCLRQDRITFGSFNNLAKFSDHTLRLWAEVLKAVPHSRLFLKTRALSQASTRSNIEAFMAGHGIAPERLIFNRWMPDLNSHLELYREIDIALDTFPYNGATTTCETLWMGVPVVSLLGAAHASRMGASILTAIDRQAWIAQSDTEYVAIATDLANNRPGLQSWRKQARRHLQASPLMAHSDFTRGFESLLEQAWKQQQTKAMV